MNRIDPSNLLRQVLSDLPEFWSVDHDIAGRADAITKTYFAVETGLRELTDEVTRHEAGKMPIDLDILQGWTARAQRVKALQDQANAEVSALADELARRGLLDSAGVQLQGIFRAFIEGVGEASREFSAAIVGAASARRD